MISFEGGVVRGYSEGNHHAIVEKQAAGVAAARNIEAARAKVEALKKDLADLEARPVTRALATAAASPGERRAKEVVESPPAEPELQQASAPAQQQPTPDLVMVAATAVTGGNAFPTASAGAATDVWYVSRRRRTFNAASTARRWRRRKQQRSW